jgi:NAD-dependent DNA ligase
MLNITEIPDAMLILSWAKRTYQDNNLTEDELLMLDELYLTAKDKYYRGEEIMTDYDFDTLEEILKFYNREVINVVDGDSTVADRVQHYTPMLSLEKAQIMDEDFTNPKTIAVIGNINSFLTKYTDTPISFEGTGKYDGNAISLGYVNNKLDKALTRGNEEQGGGIDRIDKLKLIVPDTIDIEGVVEIRGEVVIDKELWKRKYSDPNKIP